MKPFALILLALSPLWLDAKPSSESSLPLFMGYKVIGITIGLGSDNKHEVYWRTYLEFVNSIGKKDMRVISPRDDGYYSEPAWRYCMDNLADLPIYPKGKIDSEAGEGVRQLWIARKKEAIKLKEKETKEKEIRLSAAKMMFKKLNMLFGYKIGTVVDTNALKSKYGDKPSNDLRVYSFTPDKKFLSFDEYTVTLTYKTSRMFSVCASAPYSSEAFELAKSALESKFSEKMTYDENGKDYFFFGINDKGHCRSLSLGRTGDRLLIRLIDQEGYKLSKREFDEYKKNIAVKAYGAL